MTKRIPKDETGAVFKDWHGRLSIALVYPNTYSVGMSNLGFQTVYQIFNSYDEVVCERFFLPSHADHASGRLRSIESERPLTDFNVVAFSISFENDAPHMLSILSMAGLGLTAASRNNQDPLIICGGVAAFLNPEPMAPFFDLMFMGEAENILPAFIKTHTLQKPKSELLENIAVEVPGAYIPHLYTPVYSDTGTYKGLVPSPPAPETVRREYVSDISELSTVSAITTPDTSFGNTFLIETSRGCPHGCRFCSAGYAYRPPRFRSTDTIISSMTHDAPPDTKIGLMGTAISDLPGILDICAYVEQSDTEVAFSSLRANALTPDMVKTLIASGVKTATIAPDAGSERMRRVINKGITEKDILSATRLMVGAGIPNIKLYCMVGLPTETDDDIDAVIDLTLKVKSVFLEESRKKGYMGNITLGISAFVPKPVTPFQWAGMVPQSVLKKRLNKIKKALGRVPNVSVTTDPLRWSYVQAILARGDRRCADLLIRHHENGGNWPQAFKSWELNPDDIVLRERDEDEVFPWEIVDHGVDRGFLLKEYHKALSSKTSRPCPMADACTRCGVCNAVTKA